MPIYEYECSACGGRHEVLQKMSDEPLKECPRCHAQALKKLLSAAGFRLSGSGWYETDFKKGKQRNIHEPLSGKKPDAKTSPSSDAGTSSSSDKAASKPAASASKKESAAS